MNVKLLRSFISSYSSSQSLSKYNCKCCFSNHSIVGALSYFSTASLPLSSEVESPKDTIFRRLIRVSNPRDSILHILSQWVDEGRTFDDDDVRRIIKQFRFYKRFRHALEISEWMDETKNLNFTPGDTAIRLDLISKVHGLDQAEKYFYSLIDNSRDIKIYGALLNCYAHARSLDKAEFIMQKMRKLGYAQRLAYNVMLNLYSVMGKPEKFNCLVCEMEEKGISFDKFAYGIRLNAFVIASDIIGMEKLLMKMEADPLVTMDWSSYSAAANGYLNAGAFEKANQVLKKFEQLIKGRRISTAYEVLMTLYARLGRKDEVYRLWNRLKNSGKSYNSSYIAIIRSLNKLDDLDSAEKILDDWLVNKVSFDIRVPKSLLNCYCKRGHLEKAESIIEKLIDGGNEPNVSTWSSMAMGYSEYNQMEKAVETIKKAITSSHRGWQPPLPTLARCLVYLTGKGDADGAKEIIRILEERGNFSADFRDRLARYVREGNLASNELDEFEQEAEILEAEEIFGNISLDCKGT